MTESTINDRDDLIKYLHKAMVLEHATIPPYLTAYYSIHSTTNSDAAHIIRVVAVEEMLHLTLVANVLNAIGGTPDLIRPDFVPSYPTYLPDGEQDFVVDLRPFSPEAIETFCKIERPALAPEGARLVPASGTATPSLITSPTKEEMRFYSIGEFYAEIIEGLQEVAAREPDLFCGDPARQVRPEYFYSGGGQVIVVSDLDSALQALEFIAEQGEGLEGGIYDEEEELAHYYRFRQLHFGRYYQKGDSPHDAPSGPRLEIDWNAVYPVKVNAKLADYPEDSELARVARDFNAEYFAFLGLLNTAFNGNPGLLLDAIWDMFRLRDGINRLVRNPLPGSDGLHAAPTFEMPTAVGISTDTSRSAGEVAQAVAR